MHKHVYMCMVMPPSIGTRYLANNCRKDGIFLGLQPEIGKQAALNPKIEIL